MIKIPRLYPFLRALSFLLCTYTVQAQNFPSVTPENMTSVVAGIYAQFGAQIQIQPDQMIAFLHSLQPNYVPDIPTPDPAIINSTPESLTFAWTSQEDQITATGVLNTHNNQQATDLTSEPFYAFNQLNNNDLYLFAFASTRNQKQGKIYIVLATSGFIIIVDEKIMYSGECDFMRLAGSGANQVAVQLNPNDGAFFQIETKSCSNSLAGADVCYVWMKNNVTAISGVLVRALAANNDNYIVPNSANIASQTAGSATLSFQPVFNTSTQQYDQFKVVNANSLAPCAQITVSRCSGSVRPGEEIGGPSAVNIPLRTGVFPNPVQHTVQIAMPGKSMDKALIMIGDCVGNIVKTIPVIAEETSVCTLDMSGLTAGIYFIHVVLANETATFKVLKTAD